MRGKRVIKEGGTYARNVRRRKSSAEGAASTQEI